MVRGRGKLSMKLIASKKTRKTTFCKRKKCLMKKAYELSTLCDVRTCVLIHGPTQEDQSSMEVHTWPLSRNEVENTIGAYLQQHSRKCSDLYDFFLDRKGKIETEISKLREDASETKYPKWDERLEYLLEYQLKLLMDDLGSKIDVANRMIENSSIETQWPFHYQLQAEEAPQIQASHDLYTGNSIPMMPMDHEIDLFDFMFGSSNGGQIQNNYEHLQSLFYNDPMNGMIMEDNNMAAFSNPDYSTSMPGATNSQMMKNDIASNEVHDHQLDNSDYEYLMMLLTSEV